MLLLAVLPAATLLVGVLALVSAMVRGVDEPAVDVVECELHDERRMLLMQADV